MKTRTMIWAAAAVALAAGSALSGCSSRAPGLVVDSTTGGARSVAVPSNWLLRNAQDEVGMTAGSPLAWEYGRNDAYHPMSPAFAPAGVSAVYQRDSQRTIHGEPFDTFIRRTWTYERTVR